MLDLLTHVTPVPMGMFLSRSAVPAYHAASGPTLTTFPQQQPFPGQQCLQWPDEDSVT